jgi:hypothetical protein
MVENFIERLLHHLLKNTAKRSHVAVERMGICVCRDLQKAAKIPHC